jgi:uncharacterized protein YndB with AHSA1/START domain
MTNADLGEITKCYTLTYNRRSKHSPARLWKAITDGDEINKWMDYPSKVDLRVGGEWHVDFSRTDDGEIPGVIVRVEPEKVLTYTWGLSVIEWTIAPADDGCTYRFVQAGLALRDIEDEEGLAAGWHEFFDRLDLHLDGEYIDEPEQKRRWNELKPPYRKLLDAAMS